MFTFYFTLETMFRDYPKRNVIKQTEYIYLLELFFMLKLCSKFQNLKTQSKRLFCFIFFIEWGPTSNVSAIKIK